MFIFFVLEQEIMMVTKNVLKMAILYSLLSFLLGSNFPESEGCCCYHLQRL